MMTPAVPKHTFLLLVLFLWRLRDLLAELIYAVKRSVCLILTKVQQVEFCLRKMVTLIHICFETHVRTDFHILCSISVRNTSISLNNVNIHRQ